MDNAKLIYIDPPLPEVAICPICQKRPIPGYVNGPGIYLERMRYQCYKKAGSQTVREGGGWQVGKKGGR